LFHHLHIIIITFAILLFYYIVLQHLAKIQNYYAFAMQLIVNLQKTAIPPSQRPLPRHRVNNHSFHIANARASIQTLTANTRKTNQGGKPFPSSPPSPQTASPAEPKNSPSSHFSPDTGQEPYSPPEPSQSSSQSQPPFTR
jgi:hypothetical protein